MFTVVARVHDKNKTKFGISEGFRDNDHILKHIDANSRSVHLRKKCEELFLFSLIIHN